MLLPRGKRKSTIRRTGTPWVNARLDAFATFLRGYRAAVLQTPGTRTCVEAFVGGSYRELREFESASGDLVVPELAANEPQALLAEVAQMMLETNPAFDAYRFLDPSGDRRRALDDLAQTQELVWFDVEKSLRTKPVRDELARMAMIDWKDHRALLFLDPFATDVDWSIIAAVGQTHAVDLWLLYPVGVGIDRLGSEALDVPRIWRRHVDDMLGTDAWFEKVRVASVGLHDGTKAVADARLDVFCGLLASRLATVFPIVEESAGILRGAEGQPLYACCYAVCSEASAAASLRYARALLNRLAA